MPELPEVETTKRGIETYLKGYALEAVKIRQSRLRWPVDDEIQALEGKRIISVSRRAKYILIEFEAGFALWHLGMSGSLRLVELSEAENFGKHDHIDWRLSSGKILRYHDPRRFGALLWVEDPLDNSYINHLGPEPLSDEFDGAYLYEKSRNRKAPIKTFIMDGKIVVGVGNIYANESLFLAGIKPTTPAGKISKARMAKLVLHIKQVLVAAIEQGGTTLKDFVGGDGKPGYFAQQLNVYGRGGEACLHCKKTLKEIRQGQRATVYCPVCQK
jgi:formamidopyrimidine-DNA glycosylase